MEDKRGIKRERSPSTEGSPAASDAKTPPPAPSGTPSSLGSLSEVSSRRPRSAVFEQGGPSRKPPVIDLSSSSDEEDSFIDTSCDFEFVQRLYGELNCDLLGPPGDGKVIILNDFDEEKRRRLRRSLPVPKMRLLLLQSTRSQPPPPMIPALRLRSLRLQLPLLPMTMKTQGWCQMIVVMA
jgi:hypothetical protein